MSAVVLLDAGPLGMITNPRSFPENEECRDWLAALLFKGAEVVVPEIADYEVRRELLRADKSRGLARLDALRGLLAYAPITTPVMVRAAGFWAAARKQGRQSAGDASLDADMILAAQETASPCASSRTKALGARGHRQRNQGVIAPQTIRVGALMAPSRPSTTSSPHGLGEAMVLRQGRSLSHRLLVQFIRQFDIHVQDRWFAERPRCAAIGNQTGK